MVMFVREYGEKRSELPNAPLNMEMTTIEQQYRTITIYI